MIEEIDNRIKTFYKGKRVISDNRDPATLPLVKYPKTIRVWRPKKKDKKKSFEKSILDNGPRAVSLSKLEGIFEKRKSEGSKIYYKGGKKHTITSQ